MMDDATHLAILQAVHAHFESVKGSNVLHLEDSEDDRSGSWLEFFMDDIDESDTGLVEIPITIVINLEKPRPRDIYALKNKIREVKKMFSCIVIDSPSLVLEMKKDFPKGYPFGEIKQVQALRGQVEGIYTTRL